MQNVIKENDYYKTNIQYKTSDYIIKQTDNIDFLQFNKLLEFEDKLSHAFTLSNHEVGFKRYNDNIRNSSINNLIMQLNITPTLIIQPHQEHTNNIYEFRKEENKNIKNDKSLELENVDGVISNKPQIASILTFADCVPLLFYDPKNNVYANIHSGWKGTIKRIAQVATKKLVEDYNCKENNIICCIGPSIRKECFLVNDDVVEIYESEFGKYLKNTNIIEKTDKYNEKGKQSIIDNVEIIKCMLRESNIIEQNIIDCKICTYCNSDKFHSRRKENEKYQVSGSLMMIK